MFENMFCEVSCLSLLIYFFLRLDMQITEIKKNNNNTFADMRCNEMHVRQ